MDLPGQLQLALGSTVALEQELGGGGMSRVFRATERALDRPVVLKASMLDVADGRSLDEVQLRADVHRMDALSDPLAIGLEAARAAERS